jgi:hypothetical protein
VMLWSGIVLCAYPYFIQQQALAILIGVVFILLPLFVQR